MRRAQLLMCFFAISATLFINNVQARSPRQLKGEEMQGGNDANIGQIPYQVSVQVFDQNVCGGSILDERYVITAAHCVVNDNGQFFNYSMKVVGGINDFNTYSTRKVVVDVLKVYVPTVYDPTSSKYDQRTIGDIAILKLNKDLGIAGNPNLGKVQLPRGDKSYNGVSATISGFGDNKVDIVTDPITSIRDEANAENYGKMRYAKAKVIKYKDCSKYYTIIKVTKKHICAAIVQRDEDQPEGLCAGDSGGPLVYNGKQIGVVSNSPFGCREDIRPAVYTRVSKYLDFINAVLDGKTDSGIRSNTLKILP